MDLARIRKISVLRDLPEDELKSLAQIMTERRFKEDAFIICVEEQGPNLFFMIEGKAKVTLHSSDGKEVVLAHLEEGDFVGEIALLTGEDRSANVVALTDCVLLALGAEDFHRHIRENSGFAVAIMKELALRLRAASTKIGDLALYDVYRRVARTLKSIGEPQQLDGAEVFVIQERPTHQELAAMSGTSREMVTRALKNLEDDNCIVVQGKKIILKRIPH